MTDTTNSSIALKLSEKYIEIAEELPKAIVELKYLIQGVTTGCKSSEVADKLRDISTKIDDLWEFSRTPELRKFMHSIASIEKHEVVLSFKADLKEIAEQITNIKKELNVGNIEDTAIKKEKWKGLTAIIVQLIIAGATIATMAMYMNSRIAEGTKNTEQHIERTIFKK